MSDQSSLLLAISTPVITFTTTIVSTSMASGSLPSVTHTGAATLATTLPAPFQAAPLSVTLHNSCFVMKIKNPNFTFSTENPSFCWGRSHLINYVTLILSKRDA